MSPARAETAHEQRPIVVKLGGEVVGGPVGAAVAAEAEAGTVGAVTARPAAASAAATSVGRRRGVREPRRYEVGMQSLSLRGWGWPRAARKLGRDD